MPRPAGMVAGRGIAVKRKRQHSEVCNTKDKRKRKAMILSSFVFFCPDCRADCASLGITLRSRVSVTPR